jgi:ribosomal protein L7Ae-like RNA K-turn-binding protein
VHCVVLAADASARTRDKVERLALARGVPVVRGPVAAELGAGLGRPPVQAVGVEDGALARGVVEAEGRRS